MTPEERAAQRRIVPLLRTCAVVGGDGGLTFWREEGAAEWKSGADEIALDLDTLNVPYSASVTKRQHPPWRSAKTKKPVCRWWLVYVAPDDLPSLARWSPSLRRWLDAGQPGEPSA